MTEILNEISFYMEWQEGWGRKLEVFWRKKFQYKFLQKYSQKVGAGRVLYNDQRQGRIKLFGTENLLKKLLRTSWEICFISNNGVGPKMCYNKFAWTHNHLNLNLKNCWSIFSTESYNREFLTRKISFLKKIIFTRKSLKTTGI